MKTVDYDKLASSAPLNTDAARAYGMRGDSQIVPPKPIPATTAHWHAQPLTTHPPKGKEHIPGLVRGKLKVIGYYGPHPKDGGSRWVVRCVCGRFELRTTKAVKRHNMHDECEDCGRTTQAKRQLYFDRHGRWPE